MKKLTAVLFAIILALTAAAAGAEDGFLIVAPSGAPAMAVSGIWAENNDAVKTIGADTIAEAFGSAEADFIIAPINAGAKLFKAGKSTYRLAAVVTWGNLVFASKAEGFTPEMINGKKLVLFGENTINASIALDVLEKKGITPSEIEYLAGAAETQALLLGGDADVIVMTAEPAITAAKMKDEMILSVPLNDLYKEVTGFDGFTQAGLFVREKTAAENPELVREALEKIRASVEMCEKDPETVAKNVVAMEILPKEPVALKALPGCSIRWMEAKDAREQIETTAGIDLKQFGGELPADDFYFSAE
jgi:NitT/TauT family transport system substrate-binding protein